MTITRTKDGFVLTGTSTYFVTFGTLDGEPAAYFWEAGEPLSTIVTTDHPRGLWYFIYHTIRHAARWKAEKDW